MSKKRSNPYRSGSKYSEIFEDLRKSGSAGVTRNELLKAGYSTSDITVILSPREDGKVRKGADCRGNFSAQGHKYFVSTKVKDDEKRYILRWRKTELEPNKRGVKPAVAQKKTKAKAKAPAKAPEVATA
jgi:hypothetical protein